jgi:flagellar protein FliO/FliZ
MDVIDIGRYLGALLLVLALVVAAGLAARKFSLPGLAQGLLKPQTPRRLAVVESLMLSPRQRLLLIRRDEVEHLIVLTPDGAVTVESAIAAKEPQV